MTNTFICTQWHGMAASFNIASWKQFQKTFCVCAGTSQHSMVSGNLSQAGANVAAVMTLLWAATLAQTLKSGT